MKFGTNSRKGSSSLIIVMVVVVIALAGTAIYAALDNTVLTKNGYAMPGSTATYHLYNYESNPVEQDVVLNIYGYSDGFCIMGTDATDLAYYTEEISYILDSLEVSNKISTTTGKVDVPGLGNAESVTKTIDLDTMTIDVTTVLNGLVYSMVMKFTEIPVVSIELIDSDLTLGDYPSISGSKTLSNSTKTLTVTIEAESISVDDTYLYKVTKSDEPYSQYFVGDKNMIPAFAATGSSSLNIGEATINFDNDGLTSVTWDNVVFS